MHLIAQDVLVVTISSEMINLSQVPDGSRTIRVVSPTSAVLHAKSSPQVYLETPSV